MGDSRVQVKLFRDPSPGSCMCSVCEEKQTLWTVCAWQVYFLAWELNIYIKKIRLCIKPWMKGLSACHVFLAEASLEWPFAFLLLQGGYIQDLSTAVVSGWEPRPRGTLRSSWATSMATSTWAPRSPSLPTCPSRWAWGPTLHLLPWCELFICSGEFALKSWLFRVAFRTAISSYDVWAEIRKDVEGAKPPWW